MPTCENCQIVFKASQKPVEVTSLRVLCPACERERRAQKSKLQESKTHGADAKAVLASATQRASTVNAPNKSLSPAAGPNSDVAPTLTAPPADVPLRPHAKPKARAADEVKPPKKRSRDVERGSALLKEQSSKTLQIVWGIAAVLLVAAGGLAWFKKQSDDKKAAIQRKHDEEVSSFKKGFNSFDITKKDDALAAIAYAEGHKIWEAEEFESDVRNRIAKAKTNIEAIDERGSLYKQLETIEQDLNDSAITTDKLASVRRSIDDLVPKAELVGTEFSARLAAARIKVGHAAAVAFHDEAKAAAADPANARTALQVYARAEDEIRPLLDESYKTNNKEDQTFFGGHYREVINESSALSEAVFTPDAIEKTPWRDLLAGDGAKSWKAAPLKGFDYRVENGVFDIKGPDADTNKLGVLSTSLGDTEQWRDFALDLEFTIEKGKATMFLRLGNAIDSKVETIDLSTQGENAFTAKETYEAELSLIGSKLHYAVHSVEFTAMDAVSSWTKSRKGSIGLVIDPETRIKFTKFRIRVLR